MPRDDERLARASRALRRRQGLTQQELAGEGKSRHIQHLLESGRAGRLQLDDIRSHFRTLGANIRVTAWWNGASLDRLIDSEHAAVVEASIRELTRYGWSAEAEVTFNEWGERGSIDVLGGRKADLAVVVGEAKSAWGSIEETLRALDTKIRLAPTIATRRFGWSPRTVGALLVFPEDATARRVAQRHSATLETAFPGRNREVRRWLAKPDGPLRGLWFLSSVREIEPGSGESG
ncbi:MAG: hypothetical protein QFC55_04370 [Chloroflexota bacterium]|nr:hypothetical protein [Chloroflexota bacterium]